MWPTVSRGPDSDVTTAGGDPRIEVASARNARSAHCHVAVIEPEAWIEQACKVVGRELTDGEWDEYVPGEVDQRPVCT